jgi:hypothetical protein
MFIRVTASLLALVLFWSGLSAQEQAVSHGSPGMAWADVQMPAPSPYAGTDGSVDDHHLDDQPVQAQVDLPGLLQGGCVLPAPSLAMAAPAPLSMRTLRPPYLDGPQRPPCVIRTA